MQRYLFQHLKKYLKEKIAKTKKLLLNFATFRNDGRPYMQKNSYQAFAMKDSFVLLNPRISNIQTIDDNYKITSQQVKYYDKN